MIQDTIWYIKWSTKYRFWRFLHLWVNKAAWKFADPGGPVRGKVLRIEQDNFWWRLKDYVVSRYTTWFINEVMHRNK